MLLSRGGGMTVSKALKLGLMKVGTKCRLDMDARSSIRGYIICIIKNPRVDYDYFTVEIVENKTNYTTLTKEWKLAYEWDHIISFEDKKKYKLKLLQKYTSKLYKCLVDNDIIFCVYSKDTNFLKNEYIEVTGLKNNNILYITEEIK